MVVQREPLEHLDTWPGFGHPSDGHDLKQKERQRSAGFADKTGGHSSAKGRSEAWKERKDVGWVARWEKRRREAAQNWEAGAALNAFLPVLPTFQSCWPSSGPLACLPVLPPGPDTISPPLWLSRPKDSGSDLPPWPFPGPSTEVEFSVLAPSP